MNDLLEKKLDAIGVAIDQLSEDHPEMPEIASKLLSIIADLHALIESDIHSRPTE